MHYIELYNQEELKSNYLSTIDNYLKKSNLSILYEYKNKSFKSNKIYINFLNQNIDSVFDRSMKKIIEPELIKLETNSSGMGDLFLFYLNDYFKKEKNIKNYIDKIVKRWDDSVERFNKSHVLEFINNNIENSESKEICENILNHSPSTCSYFVQETNKKDNLIKLSQKIIFDLKFDHDFIEGRVWKRNEAKVILIDGFIDSLGEIHHLLHKASEDKDPYLIVCKGIREDAKSTIIHNNNRGTIDVMVVSLDINEENVNVINDISACMGIDIVSALKGDTISKSVKEDLKTISNVSIDKKNITFKISENNNSVLTQRNYLVNKKNKLNQNDPNYSYISKRIKNLSAKRIDLYLRDNISQDVKIEIDYFLKFLINGKTGIIRDKKSKKIYTLRDIVLFKKSFNSIINVIENIGCYLLLEEGI